MEKRGVLRALSSGAWGLRDRTYLETRQSGKAATFPRVTMGLHRDRKRVGAE